MLSERLKCEVDDIIDELMIRWEEELIEEIGDLVLSKRDNTLPEDEAEEEETINSAIDYARKEIKF